MRQKKLCNITLLIIIRTYFNNDLSNTTKTIEKYFPLSNKMNKILLDDGKEKITKKFKELLDKHNVIYSENTLYDSVINIKGIYGY